MNTMSDCIEWTGNRNKDGYARFGQKLVSRLVWSESYGPIPPKLCVLHSCDNPGCVAPDHLFLGTQGDNMRDRDLKGRHPNSQKTHCKWGHFLDGIYAGKRFCKKCQREAGRRYDANRTKGETLAKKEYPDADWSDLPDEIGTVSYAAKEKFVRLALRDFNLIEERYAELKRRLGSSLQKE